MHPFTSHSLLRVYWVPCMLLEAGDAKICKDRPCFLFLFLQHGRGSSIHKTAHERSFNEIHGSVEELAWIEADH